MNSSAKSPFFSLVDLASMLGTSIERLNEFVEQEPAWLDLRNGSDATIIADSNVAEFIAAFCAWAPLPSTYYPIPAFLADQSARWARALVNAYRHPAAFPSSLAPEQGFLLHSLVRNISPKFAFEIGCFMGISSLWISSALGELGQQGKLASVDLFQPIYPWPPFHYGYLREPFAFATQLSAAAGLEDSIAFLKSDSASLGRRYEADFDRPIDLLFIDGDHTISGCVRDFATYYPHVAVGGYIILHDIHPAHCGWHGPRWVIDHYIKHSKCFDLAEMDTRPENFGMAIIRKRRIDKTIGTWCDTRRAKRKFHTALSRCAHWRTAIRK